MSAPVPNTCPAIDGVIKRIQAVLKIAERGMKQYEKRSDEWDMLHDIENELWGVDGAMEELREANLALRQWGEDNEAEVKSLTEYVDKLDKINNEPM